MNLQEAQKSINKKSDDYAAPIPLPGAKIQESLNELKEGLFSPAATTAKKKINTC